MTQEDTIKQIYAAVKTSLPSSLLGRLKFKNPDYIEKKGSWIWRGRILGSQPQSIFDAKWCFYEVGVGRYAVDPPNQGNSGGVGLVCFVENSKCGKGIHAAAMSDLVSRFSAAHPHFSRAKRGDNPQSIFKYYMSMLLPDEPARDLSQLILDPLDSLESLHVAK